MAGHVRMDKDLKEDPRVLKLADAVLDDWIARGLPAHLRETFSRDAHNAVTGALFALWRHADTYLVTGDVTLLTVTQVASITGLSVTVVTQFPHAWLTCRDDGTVELPDYTLKNYLITKDIRREQNRIRQERFREKQRNARNALLSHQDNGRNSPSRVRAPARDPIPIPSSQNPPFPPQGGNGANAPRERRGRSIRDGSLQAWRVAAGAVDQIKNGRGTWADVIPLLENAIAERAIQAVDDGDFGHGCRRIADRDRFTTGKIEAKFRAAYEQLLERQEAGGGDNSRPRGAAESGA